MTPKLPRLTVLLLIALLVAMVAALTVRPVRAEPGDPPAALPATPPAAADGDADRWSVRLGDADPAIQDVLAAAYATAGLARDPSQGWIRRARLSGLVPWLTVRTTRDTSWQDDQSEVGHGTTLELRATWRLDRLVFDSRELQVSSVEAGRHRDRRRLATRVIRTYFAWRRAGTGSDDERSATRRAEATAELDALTDGWFSDELAGHHRHR